MKHWWIKLAQAVIVLAMPVVLALLPVRVIMRPWIIRFEYGRPGFPPDIYGMPPAERERLALAGVESVAGPGGMEVLYQARFDDGQPAFTEREISHMLDVRIVANRLFNLQTVLFLCLAVAAIGLYRDEETRPALAAALRTGALTILVAVLGLGLFGLLAWDSFFTAFHRVFFSGDTWLFAYSDTLIRLYPVQFWIDVTAMICVSVVTESIVLGAAAWWWRRRF